VTALCGLDDCARPAPTATICEQHWWQLDQALRGVSELLAELDTTLARMTKIGPAGEKVTGKGETAVAFHVGAGDTGGGLRDAVIGWARQTGMPWCEYATTATTHLRDVLPDLRAWGDLPTLADEILDAHARATAAIDAPAYRSIIDVGGCPEAGCNGLVRAYIPTDTDRPGRLACDVEPAHWWGTAQWLRVAGRMRGRAA
jgi:hypothetical protein